jgi:hypothetical protein
MTIEMAKKTLNRAQAELHQAKDEEDRRQASEKGWRAAREAVYAVIEAADQKPKKSTLSPSSVAAFEVDFFGRGRGRIQMQPLSAGYVRAMDILHGACFYENECPTRKELENELNQVAWLIEQAEQDIDTLLAGRKSRRKSRRKRR